MGAELFSIDEKFSSPSFNVKAIDPTGAGDTFAGGLAAHLSETKKVSFDSLKKGLVLGTILASFTVEGLGTSSLEKVLIKNNLERLEIFINNTKIDLKLSR